MFLVLLLCTTRANVSLFTTKKILAINCILSTMQDFDVCFYYSIYMVMMGTSRKNSLNVTWMATSEDALQFKSEEYTALKF